MSAPTKTDVLIVGAGPVGLFAVFELGLFDLKCHLVDILDRPGGQCTELYPDKPIYDIPAFPVISAQSLVDRLMEQVAPFNPTFTFNRMICAVEKLKDGTFRIATDADEIFHARFVVIAAGGGAFQPRRAPIPGIEFYEGRSVHYSVRHTDDFKGHDLVIVGGGDSALDWAINLQPVARSLTLVHRRAEFRAAPATVAKLRALEETGSLNVLVGQVAGLKGEDGQLSAVTLQGAQPAVDIACTRMLPFFGLTNDLGPLAQWGLNLHENTIPVDTERFETSVPGIFAIGDINSYPGKLRLILCGFHEAALVAQAVRRAAAPTERVVFQHTTSSTSLQRKLGAAE